MVDLLNLPQATRIQIYLSIGLVVSVIFIVLAKFVYTNKATDNPLDPTMTYGQMVDKSWPFMLIIGALLWPMQLGGLFEMITK